MVVTKENLIKILTDLEFNAVADFYYEKTYKSNLTGAYFGVINFCDSDVENQIEVNIRYISLNHQQIVHASGYDAFKEFATIAKEITEAMNKDLFIIINKLSELEKEEASKAAAKTVTIKVADEIEDKEIATKQVQEKTTTTIAKKSSRAKKSS